MDGVRVRGRSGPPVLLLPGGAESCDGFFPGLPEGLVADPGARVVLHDRPGTGTSPADGQLADASAHLGSVVDELGCGPVVVVGQSLGGAVAALLACDRPDVVAGLVLLDPTPIDDPTACGRLELTTSLVGRIRPLHRSLSAALRAGTSTTPTRRSPSYAGSSARWRARAPRTPGSQDAAGGQLRAQELRRRRGRLTGVRLPSPVVGRDTVSHGRRPHRAGR